MGKTYPKNGVFGKNYERVGGKNEKSGNLRICIFRRGKPPAVRFFGDSALNF